MVRGGRGQVQVAIAPAMKREREQVHRIVSLVADGKSQPVAALE